MNIQEIKSEFLFKYDAASNGGPDLNNYEVSICLTQGAKDLYNAAYQTYETSELSKRLLAPFLKTLEVIPETIGDPFTTFITSKVNMSEDINFRIKESVILEGCSVHPLVFPIDKDSLTPALNNPFKQPTKRRVLREDLSFTESKLYSNKKIKNYRLDYLIKDTPIVVADFTIDPELEGTETVEGVNSESLTMIPGFFHDKLIDRAVIHAIKITRENSLQTNINI